MDHSTDHREIITRTAIGQNLKMDAIRDICWLLVFIPFAVLWIVCLDAVMEGTSVFHILVWAFVLVLSTALFVGIAKTVYDRVRVILAVNAGKYTVSEDILCQRVERENPWYCRPRYNRCTYVFSFASGKTCVSNSLRHTNTYRRHYAQQLSKEGDGFYVVFLDHAPEKIRLVYPGILFRYENR